MFKFSSNEIKDLIISFFVISLAFAILYSKRDLSAVAGVLPIVMVGVGSGFVLHEIAHKIASMHYGYWAEFKIWIPGLLIALVSPFFGFIFAAPGAVYIYGQYIEDRVNGIISIAGPVTNILLGIVFLLLSILTLKTFQVPSYLSIILFTTFNLGFAINSFLAFFNLLPIGILDGAKILKWNILIWLITIIIAGLMVYVSMFIGAQNITMFFR